MGLALRGGASDFMVMVMVMLKLKKGEKFDVNRFLRLSGEINAKLIPTFLTWICAGGGPGTVFTDRSQSWRCEW